MNSANRYMVTIMMMKVRHRKLENAKYGGKRSYSAITTATLTLHPSTTATVITLSYTTAQLSTEQIMQQEVQPQ
jgi:hypothetical protein